MMRTVIRVVRKRIVPVAAALGVSVVLAGFAAEPVLAMEPGTYLVTVTPSYTDPETGRVEDPGNNEAIGQGMTEKLCGPTGLLEVESNGGMYLTVRYYLAQFIRDVSFEERNGGSYSTLAYRTMQTKSPVDGAANIDDKYGYTDYRMKIVGYNSVFRAKAYVEPMGRSVVYFYTCSNPVAGSGDFVTGVPASSNTPAAGDGQDGSITQDGSNAQGNSSMQDGSNAQGDSSAQADSGAQDSSGMLQSADLPKETGEYAMEGAGMNNAAVMADGINGSGAADAPLTGIPAKPGIAGAATGYVQQNSLPNGAAVSETAAGEVEYHLDTRYDLSGVPIAEARALTAPMLQAAVGITGLTGEIQTVGVAETSAYKVSATALGSGHSTVSKNKTVMMALLVISAGLFLYFGLASVPRRQTQSGNGAAGNED